MGDLYLGLMSGTSADGIDATLIEIGAPDSSLHRTGCPDRVKVLGHLETEHPPALRADILELCQPGDNEIERLGQLDQQLGDAFAQAALGLLQKLNIPTSAVRAIGSHGQTIRHHPLRSGSSTQWPFTLQIGDPNRIAEVTGITTVADFRRRDMAAGGQGAPLAPAFHQAVLASHSEKRAVVNIGGIANLSDLSRADGQGFDCGPGNALMDAWIQRHQGQRYDAEGRWAASGQSHQGLLDQLLQHPYFTELPPKSTGREDFHLAWLDQRLKSLGMPVAPMDVQATLLQLTADSIVGAVRQHMPDSQHLYVCGGGALNQTLMQQLAAKLSIPVSSTEQIGLPPQQVEGAAFAWLAKQTLQGLPGNLPAVTGAGKATVLGAIYPGN